MTATKNEFFVAERQRKAEDAEDEGRNLELFNLEVRDDGKQEEGRMKRARISIGALIFALACVSGVNGADLQQMADAIRY